MLQQKKKTISTAKKKTNFVLANKFAVGVFFFHCWHFLNFYINYHHTKVYEQLEKNVERRWPSKEELPRVLEK